MSIHRKYDVTTLLPIAIARFASERCSIRCIWAVSDMKKALRVRQKCWLMESKMNIRPLWVSIRCGRERRRFRRRSHGKRSNWRSRRRMRACSCSKQTSFGPRGKMGDLFEPVRTLKQEVAKLAALRRKPEPSSWVEIAARRHRALRSQTALEKLCVRGHTKEKTPEGIMRLTRRVVSMAQLHAGTSGWAYPSLKPEFSPANCRSGVPAVLTHPTQCRGGEFHVPPMVEGNHRPEVIAEPRSFLSAEATKYYSHPNG